MKIRYLICGTYDVLEIYSFRNTMTSSSISKMVFMLVFLSLSFSSILASGSDDQSGILFIVSDFFSFCEDGTGTS